MPRPSANDVNVFLMYSALSARAMSAVADKAEYIRNTLTSFADGRGIHL